MLMPRKSSARSGLLMLILFAPGLVVADLDRELRDCAAIADDMSRLECFDRLAQSREQPAAPPVAAEPATAPTPAPVASSAAAPEPAPAVDEAQALDDEVGRTARRAPDGGKRPRESWVAEVSRCDEAVDGKMLFFFENGQIWKQSKSRRVSIEDCSVEATLTKDMFGFKMSLAGYDRTVRVRRIR